MVLTISGCDPLPRRSLVNAVLNPSQPVARVADYKPPTPKQAPARATNRRANLSGKTLIIEYHKLSARNTLLDRTPAKFRQDLEKLYKDGFRPVTVSEWLDGQMPLPPGASPVILTFDDAHPSQLQLTKQGALAPNCFVGIWTEFAAKHPDFPVHGTFFILPNRTFGSTRETKQKVAMLQQMGSEVACHTWNHPDLSKLSDEQVMREIAMSLDWLEREFGVTNTTLAFPYGNQPRNRELVKGFTWNGKQYHLRAAFVAAGNPADQPDSPKFDPWRIPRSVACENMGGSSTWIRVMKTSKKYPPYVAP